MTAREFFDSRRPPCPSCEVGSRGFSGEVGQCWVNDTSTVYYQFIAGEGGCCGCCFQNQGCIGPWWGIPICRGCACLQRAIRPGESSLPFVSFIDELKRFTEDQRHALVGRSNWQLLAGGLVGWVDVVTPTRVRAFHEVIDRMKLSREAMLAAGVPSSDVEAAWSLVFTPERLANDARRRELLERLRGAGLSDEQIRREVARRLSARVVHGDRRGREPGDR